MNRRGDWCKICAGLDKLTLEECHEYAKNKGGECLSTEYINVRSKMKWKCKKNHEWEINFGAMKNQNSWCKSCFAKKNEDLCRRIFEAHYKEKFPSIRPKFLKGLEIDGYCEKLKIGFEYNGRQHETYIPFFHRNGKEDLIKQKERDIRKYKLCEENEIKLIVIPHIYTYKEPDILKNYIEVQIKTKK